MRNIFVLIFALITTTKALAGISGSTISIPGTGLTLIPPPGLTLAPAGATLIDNSGETFINFMMSDAKLSLENDPTWRAIFNKPPEHVSNSSMSGKLYRRTRAVDGGGWDGWMLSIPRGKNILVVMAMYTGSSLKAFNSIRDHLLSISWNDKILDPELALGVSLTPKGLNLVTGAFGGLTYNESGKVGSQGPSLIIVSTPFPVSKVNSLFPVGCTPMLTAGFQGAQFIGPIMIKRKQFSFCEAWSKDPGIEMQYIALVHLNTGALLTISGTSSPTRFQESLAIFREAVGRLQINPKRNIN